MSNPQLLSQVILPIALAVMMLGMGLSLHTKDFAKVIQQPAAVAMGIGLQLFALPLLAWVFIGLWQLPAMLAAGLVLLAAAPGGATSNILSYLSGGDAALSVCLTAIISLLIPFTLPLLLNLQFGWLGLDVNQFQLPVVTTILQLLLITIVPVAIGMTLNHHYPKHCKAILPVFQRLTGVAFIALIIALAWVNWQKLPDLFSIIAGACFCLCLSAMLLGGLCARVTGFTVPVQRSIAMELGIQNAGLSMVVAATLLSRPELIIVPLFYGIAMNLPAFALVAIARMRSGSGADRIYDPA